MSKSYVRTLAALAVVLSAASIQALSSPVHAADAATTKAVFWSMDTARKTPFNIEPVKDDTFKDYTINEFFLTSAPIEGVGADKIHVILARPTHPDHPVPLFITFEPFEIFKNDVTYSNIAHLGQRLQCATLFVDNGDRNTKGYSQWVPNAGPMGVDPEPSSNFSYHMIMATRRVIDYVTTLPEIDKTRIGCGGGSFGGWYSMILAGVDDRVGLMLELWRFPPFDCR